MARTKQQGALVYDSRMERYDIRFDLRDYLGGLHCGHAFEGRVEAGNWSGLKSTICAALW